MINFVQTEVLANTEGKLVPGTLDYIGSSTEGTTFNLMDVWIKKRKAATKSTK